MILPCFPFDFCMPWSLWNLWHANLSNVTHIIHKPLKNSHTSQWFTVVKWLFSLVVMSMGCYCTGSRSYTSCPLSDRCPADLYLACADYHWCQLEVSGQFYHSLLPFIYPQVPWMHCDVQRWFNAGPTSTTLDQHWINVGSIFRVRWVESIVVNCGDICK